MSKIEKTRKAILNAAIAVLSRKSNSSLADIADHAGVGRATLHRHFKSRDDLIQSIAMEAIRETDEVCLPAVEKAETAEEALFGVFEAIIPLGDRYNFLSNDPVAKTDPEVRREYNRQLAQVLDLVKSLKKEKRIAKDLPDAWVVAAIDAMIYAAWDSVEDGYITPQESAKLAMRTLMKGLSDS